jgi:hypothetical protein
MAKKTIKKNSSSTKEMQPNPAVSVDPFAEIVSAPSPKKASPNPPAGRKSKSVIIKPSAGGAAASLPNAFDAPVSASRPKPRKAGSSPRAKTDKKQVTLEPVTVEPAKKLARVRTPKVNREVSPSATLRKKRSVSAATGASTAVKTPEPITSPVKRLSEQSVKRPRQLDIAAAPDAPAEIAAAEPATELSPTFRALAEVKLPELKPDNRARLLLQSPTKLYFYWSLRENPWQQLKRVFGADLGSYALVLRLRDLTTGTENLHLCEASGNWWFDVEPGRKYEAEVGFYAPNRPYFRLVYSNAVETPRRSPSPRPATEATWRVSADKFAEVLDVSGFTRDAYDVTIAGDDPVGATDATYAAFKSFTGAPDTNLSGINAEDAREAMLALAAGATLNELRSRFSAAMFALLKASAENLTAENARASLSEHFDIDESEWLEEQFGPAVFGASLVNFPKTLKTRSATSAKFGPRYNPVSSFSIR